jgi:hypothetical protein
LCRRRPAGGGQLGGGQLGSRQLGSRQLGSRQLGGRRDQASIALGRGRRRRASLPQNDIGARDRGRHVRSFTGRHRGLRRRRRGRGLTAPQQRVQRAAKQAWTCGGRHRDLGSFARRGRWHRARRGRGRDGFAGRARDPPDRGQRPLGRRRSDVSGRDRRRGSERDRNPGDRRR